MAEFSQGWRHFECEECGRIFECSTRCCTSPSIGVCVCGECVFPDGYRPDAELRTDSMHNLVDGEIDIEIKAPRC